MATIDRDREVVEVRISVDVVAITKKFKEGTYRTASTDKGEQEAIGPAVDSVS
jgi:hypothetical protein